MGHLFFITALIASAVAGLVRPWIGVVAAYLIAILTPQAVWWWNFADLRPAYWVLLPTLIGFFIALGTRTVSLHGLRNPRVICLLIFWLFLTLSYVFGPYVDVDGPYRFTDPEWAFSTFNKILLLCVLACCCIDSLRKLEYLCLVFVVSAVYLTYWGNNQYLSGHVMGRMAGPVDIFGVGTYSDENSFGMLFVVAGPFLWFAGMAVKQKLLRYGLWLVVPLAWHAVFLTASRAALLGVGVTTLLLAVRSKSKMLGLLLIPAFIGAYFWQAGDLMRERAATISDSQEASSASRLQAWSAAGGMIVDHPLVGVGMASFGPAFPDYSDKKPREAHNTLLQISAESGVVAGGMYLCIVAMSILGLWRNGNRLKAMNLPEASSRLLFINEATLVAFCGMFVCSMFASLQMYEIFYFLCLLTNIILFVSQRELQGQPANGAAPRGRRPLVRAPARGPVA